MDTCCVNMIVSLTTLLTQLDRGYFKYFHTKTGFLPNTLKMRLENRSFSKPGFDFTYQKPFNFKQKVLKCIQAHKKEDYMGFD